MKEGKTLLFKYYTDERVKEVTDKVIRALDKVDPYCDLHSDTDTDYSHSIQKDPLYTIEYLADWLLDLA